MNTPFETRDQAIAARDAAMAELDVTADYTIWPANRALATMREGFRFMPGADPDVEPSFAKVPGLAAGASEAEKAERTRALRAFLDAEPARILNRETKKYAWHAYKLEKAEGPKAEKKAEKKEPVPA